MFVTPTHSQNESQQLYAKLNHDTEQLLRNGKSVVFDTNFNFYADRQHLRDIARAAGADNKLIWLQTDKALAKHRAVVDSHGKPTRLYGNMSEADFDRIASHLEPPTAAEQAIIFVGEHLQKSAVLSALGLL